MLGDAFQLFSTPISAARNAHLLVYLMEARVGIEPLQIAVRAKSIKIITAKSEQTAETAQHAQPGV